MRRFAILDSPVAAALIVALRLALTSRNLVTFRPNSHDDLLFLRLGEQIGRGDWLGPLNNLTLAKGAFYPLFIATTWRAHLPLLLTQQVLYVVACLAFAASLRPFVASRAVRLLVFAAVAFNPASYAVDTASRIVREGIYPALTLFVIAAALRTAAAITDVRSRERRFPVHVAWAVVLGVAFAASNLTREEGIWILPALAGLVLLSLLTSRRALVRLGVAVGVAVAVSGAAMGAVALINGTYYGVRVENEFKSSWFSAAIGAVQRVEPASWRRLVPVPREVRLRLYEASPSFRELAAHLEGAPGQKWIGWGACPLLGICDDIAGGWSIWALRDAVAAAGYYRAGGAALASYYARVATEIDAACADGRLRCRGASSSLMPPWRSEYAVLVADAMGRAYVELTRYPGFVPLWEVSRWHPGLGPMVEQLTRTSVARFGLGGEVTGPAGQDALRSMALAIAWLYRATLPILLPAAIAGLVLLLPRSRRNENLERMMIPVVTLLVAVCTRVLVVALVDATSFPAVSLIYLAPAYPLVIAFVVLCVSAGVAEIGAMRALRPD
jgi:hypothetical protein